MGLFPLALHKIEDDLFAVDLIFFIDILNKTFEFSFFLGAHYDFLL